MVKEPHPIARGKRNIKPTLGHRHSFLRESLGRYKHKRFAKLNKIILLLSVGFAWFLIAENSCTLGWNKTFSISPSYLPYAEIWVQNCFVLKLLEWDTTVKTKRTASKMQGNGHTGKTFSHSLSTEGKEWGERKITVFLPYRKYLRNLQGEDREAVVAFICIVTYIYENTTIFQEI